MKQFDYTFRAFTNRIHSIWTIVYQYIPSSTLALCFAIFIYGCSPESSSKGSKKVKVGYLPMVVSLPHFVAEAKGYYKSERLQVEAVVIKTSNQMSQDLVSAHIDASIHLALVPLLKQLERAPTAAKIFSISAMDSTNYFDGVVVKPTSSVVTLADLSNKRVGVFPGTTARSCFADVFKKKFPAMALPIFVELDPPLHIQALERGDIEALYAYEPTLTTGIIKNSFRQVFASIYVAQFTPNPIGVGAVNAKWAKNDTASAGAFLRAIDRAVKFISENPEEARSILAKATKLDVEIAARINFVSMSQSDKIDHQNLDGYISELRRVGEISKQVGARSLCIR